MICLAQSARSHYADDVLHVNRAIHYIIVLYFFERKQMIAGKKRCKHGGVLHNFCSPDFRAESGLGCRPTGGEYERGELAPHGAQDLLHRLELARKLWADLSGQLVGVVQVGASIAGEGLPEACKPVLRCSFQGALGGLCCPVAEEYSTSSAATIISACQTLDNTWRPCTPSTACVLSVVRSFIQSAGRRALPEQE